MSDEKTKRKGHLITHTHWDREWYQSLEIYRFRLIEVFERLKTSLEDESYHSFFLDGQTLPVADYLEARPEDEEWVRKQISNGRLRIGPFHTLLDEQLVGGESFARNLMIGLSDVRKYGGEPGIGYLPDNFGHASQTPQILKGFGIETAAMMRGYDKDDATPNEAYWRGADGTRVKTLLLNCGYASFCRVDPGDPNSFERAFLSVEELSRRAKFADLLFMNGIDHSLPHPDVGGIIATVEEKYPDLSIVHTDLEAFVAAIPWDEVDFELTGEQINARLLDGTFSSRMGLKILNRRCENQLAGYAEPLSTLSWLSGNAYPAADLTRSWRHLVQAHPHDSITGCHVDVVADDMRNRLVRSLEMSEFLAGRGLDGVVGERFDYQDPGDSKTITVFNPSPHERTEVIRVEVFTPVETDLIREIVIKCGNETHLASLVALDEIPWPLRSDYVIPKNIPHKRLTLEFGPVALKPFSVETFTYELRSDAEQADQFFDAVVSTAGGKESETAAIHKGGGRLENEFVAIEVHPDATIDVTDKASGKCYQALHRIEAEMDSGNLYAFAPLLKRSRYYFTPRSMGLEEDLPTSATIRVSGVVEAPAGLNVDMTPLAETGTCEAKVLVSLKKGDPVIHFNTELDNRLTRVCLRAVFDTDLTNAVNHVQTPFDVVERGPLSDRYVYVDKRQVGADVNRYCAGGFTSVTDGADGLAMLNRGLPEYAFHKNGTLTLTLLRASNLVWGTGPTTYPGKEYPAEGGNELGRHEREYGLLLHRGRLVDSEAIARAVDYGRPVSARVYAKPAVEPFSMRFNSPSLILTAFKRAENGEGAILRFFNALGESQTAVIDFERNLLKATRCRLDETPLDPVPLSVDKTKLELDVNPKKVVTLRLEFPNVDNERL